MRNTFVTQSGRDRETRRWTASVTCGVVAGAVALASGCAAGNPVRTEQPTPTRSQPGPSDTDLDRGFQQLLASTDLTGAVVGPTSPDQDATIVVMFASWCEPCRSELTLLGELHREEPGVRIIGVNAYEGYADRSDQVRLRRFLHRAAPWMQVVRADDALMNALGRPRKIPTVFVFNRDDRLVAAYLRTRRAPPTKAELKATIAKTQTASEQ